MDNIGELTESFHQNIAAKALSLDMLREHVFVEELGEILVEAGEMEDCICCSFQGHGLKVDGYHFDEEFSKVTLVVSHWLDEIDRSNLNVTNTDIGQIFKRATNFFTKSLKALHKKIDISNEAHDLANLIFEGRENLKEVKVILITDGLTKKRPAEIEEIDGIEFTYIIWDIERICLYHYEGEKEIISIDFLNDHDGAIPCFSQGNEEGSYNTYLGYISGETLADMYAVWGTKILDMNVRVFLSARGKVNKGIRDTILNEPEMFCAYNNGITVFAREVEMEKWSDGVIGLNRAIDFQIINGGQTTASLYHAKKKNKADISMIRVQMKLIVIKDPDDIGVMVPRISEYSNTQNKVSLSDLSANDPPHPELHEISKRLTAPDPTGGSRITHWFYEKARGSYEETKNMTALTPSQRKVFDTIYPKRQRFDKNIFGKAWNTYLRKPDIVSLGGQKNFAIFNSWLKEQQDEDLQEFFKKTVSLVMLWKNAELIVRRQKFEGYRHNIVTYTLSWLNYITVNRIDLDKIWRNQEVGQSLLDSIEEMSHIVNKHIRMTDKNVTEWCKKEKCWENLQNIQYILDPSVEHELIPIGGPKKEYDPLIVKELNTIKYCTEKGDKAWFKLSSWLKQRDFLTGKARSQCFNMGRMIQREKKPSFILSLACKKAWEEAEIRGWIWNPNSNGD